MKEISYTQAFHNFGFKPKAQVERIQGSANCRMPVNFGAR